MKIFHFSDVLPQLGRLLCQRRFDFRFERFPYQVTNLPASKIGNFFAAGLNQFATPARPFGYPVVAQIEPVNYCNLRCPLCVTGNGTQNRPRATLDPALFRALMEEIGDRLLLVIFWNWGEPLLHPRFEELVASAKNRGVIAVTSTHGNVPFDDHRAEALVDSGLDSIIFAIDGASQETYSRYRKGGDLEAVLNNLRCLLAARERRRARTPAVILRTVAMRQNEGEIPRLRELARELGVDSFAIKSVEMAANAGDPSNPEFVPASAEYRRPPWIDPATPAGRRPFVCFRPWKRITVDAAGYVIPCEFDASSNRRFGHIRDGALAAWKSDEAAAFRRAFHHGHNDYEMCRECTYKLASVDECTLSQELIAGAGNG